MRRTMSTSSTRASTRRLTTSGSQPRTSRVTPNRRVDSQSRKMRSARLSLEGRQGVCARFLGDLRRRVGHRGQEGRDDIGKPGRDEMNDLRLGARLVLDRLDALDGRRQGLAGQLEDPAVVPVALPSAPLVPEQGAQLLARGRRVFDPETRQELRVIGGDTDAQRDTLARHRLDSNSIHSVAAAQIRRSPCPHRTTNEYN